MICLDRMGSSEELEVWRSGGLGQSGSGRCTE